MSQPSTLGELKNSGWESVPVKEEIRRNMTRIILAGGELFQGVLGYEETVFPQVENALLAGHDMIFLGRRGQAKTRMIRSLVGLLDEYMPIVAGSEINDDPFNPLSKYAREVIDKDGDDTVLHWIHRDERFGEKLATPDTSIADLIGEVDPIKVAEGRYLSDELTVHYGLIPRTNRGVFAINELPDLSERIQVGLLNVLEERDIQVRGYKLRLPIDVMLVASANPEDYTNRGRIISPLKDRFGSRINTHYPLEISLEKKIVEQESRVFNNGDLTVDVPGFMSSIVVTLSHLARDSVQINQRSGVSVRLSISNYEVLVAAALRRCLNSGEGHAVPRVTDLRALFASTSGKVEIESFEEGSDDEIIEHLIRSAVLTVFKAEVNPRMHRSVLDAFDEGMVVNVGDGIVSADYVQFLDQIPALEGVLLDLGFSDEQLNQPAMVASAVEFVLEGLHLNKRLNKEAVPGSGVYRARS